MYLITAVYIIILIAFIVLLILGIIQCAKNSFKAGLIFFSMMILLKAYSYISPQFINRMLQSRAFDISIGLFISIHNLVILLVEISAYVILVIGLYNLWSSKKANFHR